MSGPIFDEREALQMLIDKAVEAGKILPSDAVRADLMSHLPRFGLWQGRFVELETGISAELALAAIIEARPHIWPREYRDDDEASFGAHPTLKARAEYLRTHGELAYRQAMQDWGCSDKDLRPGTRPVAGRDGRTKKPDPADARSNPWLHTDKEAEAAKVEFIKKFGAAAAARMAKSAGRTLAGLPLRQ